MTSRGWGWSSGSKYFPSIAKTLGLTLSSASNQDKESLRQIFSSLRAILLPQWVCLEKGRSET